MVVCCCLCLHRVAMQVGHRSVSEGKLTLGAFTVQRTGPAWCSGSVVLCCGMLVWSGMVRRFGESCGETDLQHCLGGARAGAQGTTKGRRARQMRGAGDGECWGEVEMCGAGQGCGLEGFLLTCSVLRPSQSAALRTPLEPWAVDVAADVAAAADEACYLQELHGNARGREVSSVWTGPYLQIGGGGTGRGRWILRHALMCLTGCLIFPL